MSRERRNGRNTPIEETKVKTRERQTLPDNWEGLALLNPIRRQIVVVGIKGVAKQVFASLINMLITVFSGYIKPAQYRNIWENMTRLVRPINGTQANQLLNMASGTCYTADQSKITAALEGKSMFHTCTALTLLHSQIKGYVEYFVTIFGLTRKVERTERIEATIPFMVWILSSLFNVRAYVFKSHYSLKTINIQLKLKTFDVKLEEIKQSLPEDIRATKVPTPMKGQQVPATHEVSPINVFFISPEMLGLGQPREVNGMMTVPQINSESVMQQLAQILQGMTLAGSKKDKVEVAR